MEKVFLLSNENLSKGMGSSEVNSNKLLIKGDAIVEKILGPQRYLVTLEDGTKLTATGPEFINKGEKVRIKSLLPFTEEADFKPLIPNGHRWAALIPIKFGNKTSEAKLEMYVEEKNELLSKKNPIVYLVFSIKTMGYGQLQWSIHLRENQVLAQIYVEKYMLDKKGINQMIKEFEDSLKKKGFSFLAPTVILKLPFKVPTGFQLNIRG